MPGRPIPFEVFRNYWDGAPCALQYASRDYQKNYQQ
jgi:hypothetical protein